MMTLLEMISNILDQVAQTPKEVIQLSVAAIFGMLIGFERAVKEKGASIRTFSLISSGSCLFSIASIFVAQQYAGGNVAVDSSRIAAQIVSGIGFLGGGVIFKTQDGIEGITTGAMIWFSAALGMCCGFGNILLAAQAFICYYVILGLGEVLHRMINFFKEDTEK